MEKGRLGMSVDLDFWKYREGVRLDNAAVYRRACCDHEPVEGLEALPTEEILRAIGAAFLGWDALDAYNYENRGGLGAFQLSATPQALRVDCYSMGRADMKRFSSVMAGFGCPLYDPQLEVRFDRIAAFLIDEAGSFQSLVKEEFSRLLPGLPLTMQTVSWEEYTRLSQGLCQMHYNALIHRGKSQTKAVSFMRFGSGWANRPCQCKTAQLADQGQAARVLGELLQKSIGRVIGDFLERTYYQ